MIQARPNPGRAKRARALAFARWLLLSSSPLLPLAACAASDETDAPDADTRAVVPAGDSGDEPAVDAAGADAPLVPCAVGVLCSVPIPLRAGFVTAIGGRSKNDVWSSGSGGLLMRWDGRQWLDLDSGIQETLSSLVLSSDETWGVSGQLVLRRGTDPKSVRTVRIPDLYRPLTSIALLPPGDVYVSLRGVPSLAKLDFETARLIYEPNPVHPVTHEVQVLGPRASFLVPDKALWLVGEQGAIARYPLSSPGDGGAPSLGQVVLHRVASQADLFAAWGLGDELWTAGDNGTLLHFDGTEWHLENSGTTSRLEAIFGFAPNDIWAAGDNATVLHFDGDVWSRIDVGPYGGHLKAIWGAAPDDVWIGGERTMLHWGVLP
jgi:hypothetical protein